jgi:hypothetical protein
VQGRVLRLESAVPDGSNQCVFIRYYTLRRRMFVPMVIKAGAGPHQLPNAGSLGATTPARRELQPSSDDESMAVDSDQMEVDHPETGSRARRLR